MRSTPIVFSFACLALATATATACKADSAASAEPGPEREPTTVAEPDPNAPTEQPPRFWVAGGGVRAYDLDGELLSTLADSGDQARRAPDGRVVVLRESEDGATTLQLFSAEGQPGPVLGLPNDIDTSSCQGITSAGAAADNWGAPLTTQAAHHFYLNAAGTHACVSLLDRNENMVDLQLDVAVELASGALDARVVFDTHESCEEQGQPPACADWARGQIWVEGEVAGEATEAASYAIDWSEDTGLVTREGQPVAELCRDAAGLDRPLEPDFDCAHVEDASSSGRFLLISGEISEGDYIHRDIYLFDRGEDQLLSIICDEQRNCELREISPQVIWGESEVLRYSVVGESEVEALPGDRFWVEGMLLIPTRREVVNLGGTLARTF